MSYGDLVVFGPEEVYMDLDLVRVPRDSSRIQDGEWVGTEKEWREFVNYHNLTVETSDEDYAILNNRAVYVGVHYDDDYGGRGQFDDDY